MKHLALIVLVLLSGLCAQASISPIGKVTEQPSCGYTKQGGPIDGFPWSLAQPFPWDTIQGLWKVSDSPDQVIRMKVVRQDQNAKLLSVDVLSRKECNGPIMKGVGIITFAEKNVVRISLTDKQGQTFLMKLAMFDAVDLQMDKQVCGQSILVASVLSFDNDGDSDLSDTLNTTEQSNMLLKKITSSTDFYCRKRNR